jgi:hypothetical protein
LSPREPLVKELWVEPGIELVVPGDDGAGQAGEEQEDRRRKSESAVE